MSCLLRGGLGRPAPGLSASWSRSSSALRYSFIRAVDADALPSTFSGSMPRSRILQPSRDFTSLSCVDLPLDGAETFESQASRQLKRRGLIGQFTPRGLRLKLFVVPVRLTAHVVSHFPCRSGGPPLSAIRRPRCENYTRQKSYRHRIPHPPTVADYARYLLIFHERTCSTKVSNYVSLTNRGRKTG